MRLLIVISHVQIYDFSSARIFCGCLYNKCVLNPSGGVHLFTSVSQSTAPIDPHQDSPTHKQHLRNISLIFCQLNDRVYDLGPTQRH